MRREQIKVTIPQPCSQKLTDMEQVAEGGYCTACAQTVIDFSIMSDAEILEQIRLAAGGKMCGYFHPSQLDRALVTPRKKGFFYLLSQRVAASLLFMESLVATAIAQTRHIGGAVTEWNKEIAPNTRIIKGCVTDYLTHEPLCGMKVSIKGTGISTITSNEGTWVLALPDTGSGFTLQVDYTDVSGVQPDGTVIQSIMINAGDDLSKDVLFYRYPFEQEEKVIVNAYKKVLVDLYNPGKIVVTGEVKPAKRKQIHLFNWLKKKK